jgi:molecular chaperone DnaJ
MASKRDYYEILGVQKSASDDDLKSAYRKLALQHHPDRNQGNKGAEEKFKEINEAYGILSDKQKRAAYDHYGHAGVQQGGPAGPGAGGFEGAGDAGGFSDVFQDFFGEMFGGQGGGRRRGPRKGEDLRYDHTVTLREAFTGTESAVKVTRAVACGKCGGSGAKSGTGTKTCPDCKGHGQVRVSRGFFTLAQTCPRCQGQGEVVENPCPDCRGAGAVRSTDTVKIRIPPGVEEGTALRVTGGGQAGGRASLPGDLYVVVHVTPDPRFEREAENLLFEKRISIPMAALGGETEVPTVEKTVRFTIPPGTPSGAVFRVRGEGMPKLGGHGHGDLHVRVVVDVPQKLTRDQRLLLAQLAQSLGDSGVNTDEGLFKKVFGK